MSEGHAARIDLRQVLVDVCAPFALWRATLFLAAWFGGYFARDARYPDHAAAIRGWVHLPVRWLDVWGRWDTGYYLRIAREGYGEPSTLAFFPGYPAAVRLASLVQGPRPSDVALYVAALAVANAAAVAAAYQLYRLALQVHGDREPAARAVVYAFAFPGALFLACAYSESLFLLLAVSAFRAGLDRRWLVAGLLGALAALTRSIGVLLFLPLAWLAAMTLPERARRWSAAWLLLIPLAFVAWAAFAGWRTGDPLAVFHVQKAWGRGLSTPWATLLHPRGFHGYMSRIDAACAVAFAALGAWGVLRGGASGAETRALGLTLLLFASPALTSGTLMSGTRFMSVAFPAFVAIAPWGRSRVFDRGYLLVCVGLQTLMMAAWAQLQWLG